ncbi:exodeoxyribonuclease V subunit gamma [Intrasporangium sp.]|uniref:exodeoxyribonuclease V subunit gamma n=1 Tax=Intrasporangium sp. TaxID=1925024 RepID=UPI0032214DBF
MGIELHRADRPEELAAAFGALLRSSPPDVFAPEVVVVAARGMERWLAQQLSHTLGATRGDDGVCAGLQILAPQSLVGMLLGRDRDDPWQPDRLVWPTLTAIDELVGTTHFESLTRHLGAGPEIRDDPTAEWERKARQSRRYAVARRIAGLFASYARERPQLLADWEAGSDPGGAAGRPPDGTTPAPDATNPAPDATTATTPTPDTTTALGDFVWQPILWRRVVELVLAREDLNESVTERHRRVVDELSAGTIQLDLPARLSLFGHTRLAASERELLFAIGAHHEVHLWLPHPSPSLWADLAGRTRVEPRAEDTSAALARHPLLATLGRDVRELQATLHTPDLTVHEPLPSAPPPPTRLGLLQADIRANRAPDPDRATTAGDLSLQVHACHGRARQVEVLREVLLWLLAEGQGALQPRDVIVMCPDIEQFAPLIQATFGLSLVAEPDAAAVSHHPGQQLRVQLADRALAATNPLVDLAQRILDLVAGRMTVSEVLDLAGHEAVRARFGFDEESLARLGRWITDSGVRWGYDGAHRGEYGLRDLDANTWARGMDRIALGVAVAGDSRAPSAAGLPIDDIGSRDIETVGRLLELMERLKLAADAVRGPSRADSTLPRGVLSVPEWVDWLRDTIERLTDTPADQRWRVAQLDRDLRGIGEAAGERMTLRLNDVRVLLGQRWGVRPSRASFRTGAVTVCTMVPMRSVPHRAVVLLGVDDDVYPRSPITDGDDLLARQPQVGERDARSEDRQLLLDAVMAADQYLVAIYSGFDERNGSRRPPAVPLQEVISAAARTATAPGDDATSGGPGDPEPGFVRRHPLQAFDERNFTADGPLPGGTFDRVAADGARALREFRRNPSGPRRLLTEPLPVRPVTAVTVDELVAFLQNPAREFLRGRLEVTVPRELDEPEDSLPVSIDPLAQWAIGDRVLREVLAGASLGAALDREAARGSFPPGSLGRPARTEIERTVAAIVANRGATEPRTVEVRTDLPPIPDGGSTRLTGIVNRVHDTTIWVPTYSTVSAKHLVAAWVRLLALALAEPEQEHHALLSGKKGSQRLRSPGSRRATELLRDLVLCRQSGMRFPMGTPPRTASAFARVYRASGPGDTDALRLAFRLTRREWEGTDQYPGERDNPWWRMVLGPGSHIEDLNHLDGLRHFGPRIWGPIHEHLETP